MEPLPVITYAEVEHVSFGMNEVRVKFDDGEKKTLFSFYADELSFVPTEFMGLTEEQARKLRHDKDVAYLQS